MPFLKLTSSNTELRMLKFYMKHARYHTLMGANNKVADQSMLMGRLVCAFVVGMKQSQIFS